MKVAYKKLSNNLRFVGPSHKSIPIEELIQYIPFRRGFIYFISLFNYCFICLPSDSTVSEDADTEAGTIATFALAYLSSNKNRVHRLVLCMDLNSIPLSRTLSGIIVSPPIMA
jgi:hypothetical protein